MTTRTERVRFRRPQSPPTSTLPDEGTPFDPNRHDIWPGLPQPNDEQG